MKYITEDKLSQDFIRDNKTYLDNYYSVQFVKERFDKAASLPGWYAKLKDTF